MSVILSAFEIYKTAEAKVPRPALRWHSRGALRAGDDELGLPEHQDVPYLTQTLHGLNSLLSSEMQDGVDLWLSLLEKRSQRIVLEVQKA